MQFRLFNEMDCVYSNLTHSQITTENIPNLKSMNFIGPRNSAGPNQAAPV